MLALQATGLPRDVAARVAEACKAARQRQPDAGAMLTTVRDYVSAQVLAFPPDVVMGIEVVVQVNASAMAANAEGLPMRRRRFG